MDRPIDLRAIEEEVLREGQEWMRRRMEEKRARNPQFFPPTDSPILEKVQRRTLTVKTNDNAWRSG